MSFFARYEAQFIYGNTNGEHFGPAFSSEGHQGDYCLVWFFSLRCHQEHHNSPFLFPDSPVLIPWSKSGKAEAKVSKKLVFTIGPPQIVGFQKKNHRHSVGYRLLFTIGQ
jgi:hypothetical protein